MQLLGDALSWCKTHNYIPQIRPNFYNKGKHPALAVFDGVTFRAPFDNTIPKLVDYFAYPTPFLLSTS